MKANFVKERETKGAVRYKELPADPDSSDYEPGIGTIYFRRWFLKENFGGFPQTLTIQVDKGE